MLRPNQRLRPTGAIRSGWVLFDEMAPQQWNIGRLVGGQSGRSLGASRQVSGQPFSLWLDFPALLAVPRPEALPFSLPEGVMQIELSAVFQQVPEGYIGFVEELPGANTQGATLEEARTNLAEAVHLVLEANRALAEEGLRGQLVIREPLRISAA